MICALCHLVCIPLSTLTFSVIQCNCGGLFFFFKQTRNWQRKHLRHIFGYNNFLYSFGNSQLPLWLKDSGLMWIRTHTLSTCLTFNELNTQQMLS